MRPGQPDRTVHVPVHCRAVGLDDLLRSLPTLRILSFYKKEGWSTGSVFLVFWLSFPEEFESLTLKSLHLSTQLLEPKLAKFISTYSYDSATLF